MLRKCLKCDVEKEIERFCKDKRKESGYIHTCKDCYNVTKKRQRSENKEHVNRLGRENAKKNYEKYKEKRKITRKIRDEKNKEALREKRKKYWEDNAERLRKRQNELKKDPEKRAKINLWMKKYREENKEKDFPKIKARYLVEQAIKIGFILRPELCAECGLECKPDGHHEDYEKPLEVIWLCRVCHKKRHMKK